MSATDTVKAAMERTIGVITKRPAAGQMTEVMTIDMDEQGCCRVAEGDQEIEVDLSPDYGGAGRTPSPGFLVRAALGACLAQGYYMWAAYRGVPIDRLSIELQSDLDLRGNLGVDDSVPRSYLGLRYVVTVASPAPRAAVEAVIDTSDEHDWVRDVFARSVPLERELRISQSAAAG